MWVQLETLQYVSDHCIENFPKSKNMGPTQWFEFVGLKHADYSKMWPHPPGRQPRPYWGKKKTNISSELKDRIGELVTETSPFFLEFKFEHFFC